MTALIVSRSVLEHENQVLREGRKRHGEENARLREENVRLREENERLRQEATRITRALEIAQQAYNEKAHELEILVIARSERRAFDPSLVAGLVLPGWTCAACRVFNGEVKEPRLFCRACGTVCPDAHAPDASDAPAPHEKEP